MIAMPEPGEQPLVPLPGRDPAVLRAAVATIDAAALAAFEADWAATMARVRDEYSLMPARHFVEYWLTWVAVERWPSLGARLHECERIFSSEPDDAVRRAAAAEIGEILRGAESVTALVDR